MPRRCLLYYITDRTAFPGYESKRRERLLEKISEAARAGVDYIQLRERDLPTSELASLARAAAGLLNNLKAENRELRTALLINSRTDVAIAVGADGVHLRSEDTSATIVRDIWKQCGAGTPVREPVVAVSCHTPDEVVRAEREGANFVVFAPVFEKKDVSPKSPAGLPTLRNACQVEIPVLGLGGVTLKNAYSCLEAGAAGIAGIRLFQESDISEVVRQLRRI